MTKHSTNIERKEITKSLIESIQGVTDEADDVYVDEILEAELAEFNKQGIAADRAAVKKAFADAAQRRKDAAKNNPAFKASQAKREDAAKNTPATKAQAEREKAKAIRKGLIPKRKPYRFDEEEDDKPTRTYRWRRHTRSTHRPAEHPTKAELAKMAKRRKENPYPIVHEPAPKNTKEETEAATVEGWASAIASHANKREREREQASREDKAGSPKHDARRAKENAAARKSQNAKDKAEYKAAYKHVTEDGDDVDETNNKRPPAKILSKAEIDGIKAKLAGGARKKSPEVVKKHPAAKVRTKAENDKVRDMLAGTEAYDPIGDANTNIKRGHSARKRALASSNPKVVASAKKNAAELQAKRQARSARGKLRRTKAAQDRTDSGPSPIVSSYDVEEGYRVVAVTKQGETFRSGLHKTQKAADKQQWKMSNNNTFKNVKVVKEGSYDMDEARPAPKDMSTRSLKSEIKRIKADLAATANRKLKKNPGRYKSLNLKPSNEDAEVMDEAPVKRKKFKGGGNDFTADFTELNDSLMELEQEFEDIISDLQKSGVKVSGSRVGRLIGDLGGQIDNLEKMAKRAGA